MDKDTAKAWEKPWTTDEIREHSANWNLAGDSGLLNHLQQFSQSLLAKTHATEVALDKLVEDLKTTSTSVQNATNTFLFLANTQFVENRVYDDDEKETPPEEKKDDVSLPKSKGEQEAEVFQNVKQALHMGLALLDTHFEAVEVPASDSEEEESSTSVGRLVLKPKNPYLSRPLPYLIGSKEFMEDDKVGLGEISSDTEESPDQNVVQSSESDDEMEQDELIVSPKRTAALSLSDSENSEPESDRSDSIVKQKKPRTGSPVGALGEEEEEERDMFGHASPPEADVVAIAKGGLKNAFSDELSSKLMAAKSQSVSEREHKKDNMFVPSSEPEDESGLFGKTSRSFSEKQGLFDDLDDWQNTSDSLWKSLQTNKIVDTSQTSDNQDDIFSSSKQKLNIPTNLAQEEKVKESTPKSLLSTNTEDDVLFGPAEDTNDLFSQKSKVTGTVSGNSALFGKEDMEDDDDLFAVPSSSQRGSSQSVTKKKKLPGAVPVLNNVDLFGNISPIVKQNSAEEDNAIGRNFVSNGSDLLEESSSGIVKTRDLASKLDESERKRRKYKEKLNKTRKDYLMMEETKLREETENNPFKTLQLQQPRYPREIPMEKRVFVEMSYCQGNEMCAAPSPGTTIAFAFGNDESDMSKFVSNLSMSKPYSAFQGGVKENEKSSLFASQKLFQSAVTSTKIADGTSKSSLFNTDIDNDSLFDKQRHSDEGILNRNISGSKISTASSFKPKTKKTTSLFEDSDSGEDELLFSSTSSTSSRSRRSQGSGDFLGSGAERRILPKKGLFEDSLLFGAVSKDDPDVDIFSSQNDPKSKSDLVAKDNIFNGNDVIGDSSAIGKKGASSIFDDIDEVDDIFAVPKISVEKTHTYGGKTSQANLEKLSLFSDASNENIFSNTTNENKKPDFVSETEPPSQSHVSGNVSAKTSSEWIGDNTALLFSSDSVSHSAEVENEEEKKKDETKNVKPQISQKPKVPIKPPPSAVSVQTNSDSSSTSNELKIESVENSQKFTKTSSTDAEKITNINPNDNEPKTVGVSEGVNIGDNQTSTSNIKPEPPRTLNIRKTTDIVFRIPSNEDDLFESSWSEKSSLGKENANNEPLRNNSLSSSNFSKILEDFNSHTANTASMSSLSQEHSASNSPEISKERISSVADANHSVVREPHKTISSPSKLRIDPRTLLPGAKPPTMTVTSDGAIGFDKPAETTSTLHSAAKERVKIQVKRRPQTRRARQEALRASSIDYDNIDAALISQISNIKNDNGVVSSSASSSSPVKDSHPKVLVPENENVSLLVEKSTNSDIEKYPKNNTEDQLSVTESLPSKNETYKAVLSDCLGGNSALSPLTDEEDLFAVPHELPFDESSNKEMSNNGKNLFGGAPVLSPMDVKTGSESFTSQATCVADEEGMEGSENSDLQQTQDSSRKNDDLFKGLVPPFSAGTIDKSVSNNPSIVSKTEDVFDRKWLDKDLSSGNRGLFDDVDDVNDNGNDGSDDDLFSSAKKPIVSGKKTEKGTFPDIISQKPPLFSPVIDTSHENQQKKQLSSDDFLSSFTEDESLQKDFSVPPPKSPENCITDQKGSDTNSELFRESVSVSTHKEESEDLFTSNVSSKDVKSDTSVKNTEKPVTSQEKVKPLAESLFGDDSLESDDLFGSSSVPKMSVSGSSRNLISGPKSKDSKGTLFDDGDDDDDIFTVGLNKNRGPRNETLFPKEEIAPQNADADTDDLFSKRTSSSRSQGTKPSSAQKVQSFEDPLMVFNK
ncbi:WASH complex subunit 2 [Gryllus bimaculatus]|nr:WASH complex subunit 2 [Gryllus bimaculatus]